MTWRRTAALLPLLLAVAGPSGGDDPRPEADLPARSLPLRTALHGDPTLASPLERLVALFREAGRLDDLIGMYRGHLAQYPQDVSARTVWVRLLAAVGDPEAARAARAAVETHPDNAYLHFLLYDALRTAHDPGALDELDRALERETLPDRKRAWIDALLPEAVAEDRRDLAEKHLRALAALPGVTPEGRLETARKMIAFQFYGPALEILQEAAAAAPAAETGVEIEMTAASAEAGLDRAADAAGRLDRLLPRLTADYWRRPEILRRRIALVRTDAERESMIHAARARVAEKPADEAAALDLAACLAGFEFRREALEALLEAGRRAPASARIEKETIELFDRLRDERGREAWLAERLKAAPERRDFAALHVKSLFLLGRRREAREALASLIEGLDEAERPARLAELGRDLRRAALTADAGELFRRAVELAPARLDLRRELAETYLATGNRAKARELFAGGLSGEAPVETQLDGVQFMIQQEMFTEARAALSRLAQRDAANLEIRLLLLHLSGRLGDRSEGEKRILESRPLADTAPRYRLWLEGAAAFREELQSTDAFLEEERARLDEEPGGWSAARLERRLVFADVAARGGRKAEVVMMIQNDLSQDPPPEARTALRLRLISLLESDPAQAGILEPQLQALAQEDPRQADECHARLALLYALGGRADQAATLLDKINVASLRDPSLLVRLQKCIEPLRGGNENAVRILRILERLTVLDPTNRGHWEARMTALASAGDEPALRGTVRRLLAGVEGMPLSEETRELLGAHVADSCWRSIARLLAEGRPAQLADALPLVDEAERAARDDEQAAWAAWARAYVLNRLGRQDARDQAVKEMDRLLTEGSKPARRKKKKGTPQEAATPDSGPPAGAIPRGLTFPDGLTLSPARSRALVTAPSNRPVEVPPPDRQGPTPPLKVRWIFETPGGVPVVRLQPIDATRLLICDLSGTISCVDRSTGKLRWERGGSFPVSPAAASNSGVVVAPPPVPIADADGRIYVPTAGEVTCLSSEDGRRLWRAEVGDGTALPTPEGGARPWTSVFVRDGRVLAYDPASETLSAFDPATGKLLREKKLPAREGAGTCGAFGAGADLCGRSLLVYGPRTAILDVDSGETECAFEPWRVRPFPVKLKEPEDGSGSDSSVASVSVANPPASVPAARRYRIQRRRYVINRHQLFSYSTTGTAPPQMTLYLNYLQQGGMPQQIQQWMQSNSSPADFRALVAAGAMWGSAGYDEPRLGVLSGDRLLMFGQGDLVLLRLDLPLAGTQVPVSGAFVGMAGRVACLLNDGQLQLVDTAAGTVRSVGLQEIGGDRSGARFQAAVDGPVVYATGPAGILCVNAGTGRPVFTAPWPKAAAPDPATPDGQAVDYQPQGLVTYQNSTCSPCVPIADRAEGGVLYATISPSRVAALSGGGSDGR